MSIEVINCGDFSLDNSQPKPDPVQQQTSEAPKPQQKRESLIAKQEVIKTMKGFTKDDDIKQHQEHVLMLSRYGASPRFGKYLKSLSFDLTVPKLRKQSVKSLEELLQRVRVSVSNKTVSDLWTDTIIGGTTMAENICMSTIIGDTLKLKGLSEVLKDDETFLDLIEELKLNNQNLAYVSPYTRLAYTLMTIGFHVHTINSLVDKKKKKNKEPALLDPLAAEPVIPVIPENKEDEEVKQISTNKRQIVDRANRVYQMD
jgi:hypothetical protein